MSLPRQIKLSFIGLIMLTVLLIVTVLLPNNVSAADNTSNFTAPSTQEQCNERPKFLGLVPWYQYLKMAPDAAGGCKITSFDTTKNDPTCVDTNSISCATTDNVLGKTSPFLLIGLAILDDLVRVAALIAVGFVIFGGFKYMTSQGSPEDTKSAQQTIINALVGVVIAIIAAGLVGYIGTKLGA